MDMILTGFWPPVIVRYLTAILLTIDHKEHNVMNVSWYKYSWTKTFAVHVKQCV